MAWPRPEPGQHPMMRIALDAGILRAPRTGIGQYVAELGRALQMRDDLQLELFTGWGWQRDLPDAAMPGYSRLSRLVKCVVPNAYALRRALEQQRFNAGVRHLRPQLLHAPSLWPLAFDGPMVMTLHDLTHVHYPQTQPADRLREIERQVPGALQRAARILVDSQFVADEAVRVYGIPAERVAVAPLAAAAHFHPRSAVQLEPLLQPFGLNAQGYLLCVGTLEPRKNLQLAIDGYLALPAALRERFPLVIAGMPGWGAAQLQASLRRALSSGQVRLLGYQPDQQLAGLLAGARLLLFPSLYEGFGLPVLEAMASGTPVVLSRRAALPEVAGDAGLYIEPEDANGCAMALRQMLEDEVAWQTRRAAGLARASAFSWARCAGITARTYREALNS